jgi:hypothetical protein
MKIEWGMKVQHYLFVIKQLDVQISQIYFVMKLFMFQTVRLSINRSLFIVHSTMVYVIQVCRQLLSRTRMELCSILVLLKGAR